MSRHPLLGWALLAAWLAVGGLPAATRAQDQPRQSVRTLVIKDNQVLIDGKKVDKNELPKSLPLDSMTVSYSFIGIDEPVVHLRNHFFAVRPHRLELIPAEFEGARMMATDNKMKATGLNEAKGWIVDQDNGEYYSFQGERIEANEAVSKMLGEANNLYLDGLQRRNQSLFSRLSRERVLEDEAARLVEQVRSAQSDAERETHTAKLVAKLSEIFDMKQENRRAEIAQFEHELAKLRDRVDRREALKRRLIERRVALLTQGRKND